MILEDLIKWADVVTDEKIEQNGSKVWTINDQIAQIAEEVGEVRHAWRKEGLLPTTHENIDLILASVANLTIVKLNSGLNTPQFMNVLHSATFQVTGKLFKRVGLVENDPASQRGV